jgi:hypothetical protein
MLDSKKYIENKFKLTTFNRLNRFLKENGLRQCIFSSKEINGIVHINHYGTRWKLANNLKDLSYADIVEVIKVRG